MKILIDADGCPVINSTIRVAKRYNIDVILVCDTSHIFNIDNIEVIVVSKGADSVDFILVNKICVGDIVITQDYGLAAMCLAKKAIPLNQNGFVYNDENIDGMLFSRHISKTSRNRGRHHGSHIKKRTKTDDIKFETCLDKIIKLKISEGF